MLAQKPDVRVIKKGFRWFDGNVIFEKNIKKDTQFLKQVKQRLSSIDNIIHIDLGPGTVLFQSIIYPTLDVGQQVDVFYD